MGEREVVEVKAEVEGREGNGRGIERFELENVI